MRIIGHDAPATAGSGWWNAHRLLAAGGMTLLLSVAPAAENLAGNGDFAKEGDIAAQWQMDGAAAIDREASNHFMRLEVKEPGKAVMAYRLVKIAGTRALKLSFRARWTGVKRGQQPWFDARVMMEFKDADKQKIPGAPGAPYFTGSSDGWQRREVFMTVPDTATYLELMPSLFKAEAGTLDIDDLSLIEIDPADVPVKAASQALAIDARPIAGLAPVQALRVDGNRILRADGSEIWIQGVSIDSLQWSDVGENVQGATIAAIEQWHANTVRLPVVEVRWFGEMSTQKDGGKKYRDIIDQCVRAATSRGAYIIIDLHRFHAPTEACLRFWKDVAQVYKDNPGVIFELFNEPHDISWQVWRDGGKVGDKKEGDALAENTEAVTAFTAVGMQALVDGIRSTGAKNLILAGGLDWAYDISGVLEGYALKDVEGAGGIAYVTHVYPWKSQWQKRWMDVLKVHPVVMTEVGCDAVRYSFVPPERFENPYTWGPDIIACIQRNKVHWTAFSFHRNCGPPMLMRGSQNWMPTPFWGAFVRAALSGAQFTSDRLR